MKMKKQLDIKKLLLLNMPYILMGLFATNFGEGWRMAVGADASAKMLSFFSTLPVALASWWPSLHPLDLLVGLCCGAGLRLAVYLKSKNAKKYRHGMEYGSARWGTHEDIAPYIDPVFQNNVAYRKAGYSRKFREEHEQEILLHQAAKNAFDEMGVKKLPKVKDLQSEYAKLLEEKKKTYAEYRRSREEMRELLTAKANVDRLLKMDEEQKKEQEKDHGQR